MTSERQETEETFEAWYERLRRERGGSAGPLDAMDADATQMLLAAYYDRATPRAVPDETLTVDAAKANAIAVRLSAFARELGRDHPRYITLLNAILVIESRAAHTPRAGEVTEDGMADAMMAFNGWDRDEDVTPETRAKLRAHYTGNGIGKRDAMYVAVQRAVTAALGRPS